MLSKREFLKAVVGLTTLVGTYSSLAKEATQFPMKRTAIVYYSHSGNTRTVASRLSALTEVPVFEIVPQTPYPNAYRPTTNQVREEMQKGYLPPIHTPSIDLNNFDILIIGTPTWWHHIARPVASWLSQTDLSGKVIMPFNTHGGGGLMQTRDDFVQMCPKSTVTQSLTIYGSGDSDLDEQILRWLKQVNL